MKQHWTRAKLNIGLYGGTFNPPHIGHLRLAEEAVIVHRLSKIIFIPSFMPPHKSRSDVAPPQDRLEMTRLAIEDNRLFDLSDVEISMEGPSYTVNTLKKLRDDLDAELFFIIGSDSLKDIQSWHDYHKLFSLTNFIVILRPGLDTEPIWNGLPEDFRQLFHNEGQDYVHETGFRIIPSDITGLNISSTMVRKFLKQEKSIRYLVTENVRRYIHQKRLYRD